MEGFVKHTIVDSERAEIVFFHPKSNSLPSKILQSLAETINLLSSQKELKLIIIKSQGEKSFCAGASFDELKSIKTFEEGKAFFMGFANVINAIRLSKKIVISRVQNKAVGGGVGIICASDYAVATDKSALKLSEINVGIGPFVIGPVVEKKIGSTLYTQMALEAEWMDAKWAKEHGIYARIFENVGEVDKYIDIFCNNLLSKNFEAIQKIKQISWSHYNKNFNSLILERVGMSGKLILSDYTKNFINDLKK